MQIIKYTFQELVYVHYVLHGLVVFVVNDKKVIKIISIIRKQKIIQFTVAYWWILQTVSYQSTKLTVVEGYHIRTIAFYCIWNLPLIQGVRSKKLYNSQDTEEFIHDSQSNNVFLIGSQNVCKYFHCK